MRVIFHIRNAACVAAVLCLLCLLGVRLYEDVYIFGSDVTTLIRVITPLLWPVICVLAGVTLVLTAVHLIGRAAGKKTGSGER